MNGQNHHIYRLDGIEIDTSQVCLRQGGHEQHVRQKTFQVLIYLLENRLRVVSKDELIDQIWQGAAVTDNTLEQCLFEIRKVLGDDSRHPRFIKTVPRSGYRFIGLVEEVSFEHAGKQLAPVARTSFESNETTSRIRADNVRSQTLLFHTRRPVAILVVVILIASITLGFYLIRRRISAAPVSFTLRQEAGKRSIAVMFFDNQSGTADLDWLREGLADMIITDLSRSKNLTVLSRQQLRALLDRGGHNESEKIQLDEALDVAQKIQAKIVIMGSFARLGEQIRIDAQLHDARDGQLLAAERLVVDQPAQILTQVDLLSLKLASHLGAPNQPEVNAGLTSVMTNNLEAYRYYSLGVEKAQAVRNPEAISLLQKAVALDPQFAMAYARIGYAYAVAWDRQDEGKPYLEKAFQLSGRLTEKDKLYITGWYAIANRDYPGAIRSFREIVAHFPLELEAYRRLSGLLRGEEQFDEAIEVLNQGLVVDSGAKDLYNALGAAYSDAGRDDEAITMFQRYVELGPQEPNAHDSLASGYQWAGRYEEAIQEYQQALTLKPDFEVAVIHLGNTYFQQGRYREAIEQYRRYIRLAAFDLERSRGLNCIAQVQDRMGELVEADRTAKQAIKYEKPDKADVARIFMITLEKGDLATAEKLKGEVETVYAQYSVRGSRSSQRPLLYFRGSFDLKSGRPAEAIENFKEALKRRPQTWSIDAYEDCLANAYLELGRFDEASAEYERILKFNPNYPLVHYHLAQAYERKGRPDQARVEYQQFLQIWKDADADIPEVIKARKALS